MPATRRPNQNDIKPKIKKPQKLCSEGLGYGRKFLPAHPIKYQGRYDDHTRGLRSIKLSYDEAKTSYTCRHCGENMGCAVCLEDITGLICKKCHDWANEIAVRVHGPMVKAEELKQEGMKLVMMVYEGQITVDDYTKLWNEARAALRTTALVGVGA